MTIIKQLLRQAQEGAAKLELPEKHVAEFTEYMRQMTWVPRQSMTFEECEAMIRSGDLKFAGVPLKVVPA